MAKPTTAQLAALLTAWRDGTMLLDELGARTDVTTQPLTGWDSQSAIRERLALLAQLGPNVQPADWGYHPSRDFWYRCGPGVRPPSIRIRQEGSASLDQILQQFGIGRTEAMALIGYPEREARS